MSIKCSSLLISSLILIAMAGTGACAADYLAMVDHVGGSVAILGPSSAHTVLNSSITGLTNAYVPPPFTIKQAKLLADGAGVTLTGKIATTAEGELPGFFYIEEPDRSSGIRVVPTQPVSGLLRGSVVDVTGTMGTTPSGERQVADAVVTIQEK